MRDAEAKLRGYMILSPSVAEIPTGLPSHLEQATVQLLTEYNSKISDERNSGIEIDQWFADEALSLLEKTRSPLIDGKEENVYR
jgi:hypothetical protein